MFAKITKDYLGLDDVLPAWKPRDGEVILDRPTKSLRNMLEVRLLDDDRNLYYEALADEEGLEPLLSWAMRDAGATILQTKEHGAWVDTIG